MQTDHDILTKEQTYQRQMAPIREVVLKSAEDKNWSPMSRGRKAHVSLFGPVNDWSGVIDIEMERTDWSEMPYALEPGTPLTLFCSASLERDDSRFYSDMELFWMTTYEELPGIVNRFLAEAWTMFSELNDSNVLSEWPGPSGNPDVSPDFGQPRRRTEST